MLRQPWRALLLAAILVTVVPGNWNDTSTGIDLDKLRQFPLIKLRSGCLKDGSRITFDGISAAATARDAREVLLRGAGKSGKHWEAHLSGLDEVWRGDLDANGTQDYVFFGAGPFYNGRTTPSFSLSILLMDREGMPVPFFTVVYKGENGEGIKHLLDLNHDGHAELLISTYDERASDPHVGAFCSGHWSNRLYRFTNFAAEEIQGAMGGINFPLIHDWTYRGTLCPYYEESSASLVQPPEGCQLIPPSVIVYDRPRIREIAFPNPFSTYADDLSDRIRRGGAHAELHGACPANLLWAD